MMVCIAAFNASAQDEKCINYTQLLNNYNEEHGTNYRFASVAQLERIGKNKDDMDKFITTTYVPAS